MAGVLAVCSHFFFVLIFASAPGQDAMHKNKIERVAGAYVYPFFDQNWNLFVPPPVNNYKLLVCSTTDPGNGRDLVEEILTNHQANRLKGYEPFLIGLVNSIYYFENRAMSNNLRQGQVKNDLYFGIVEYFAKNYLKHVYNKDLQNEKLVLLVTEQHKPTRVYFN